MRNQVRKIALLAGCASVGLSLPVFAQDQQSAAADRIDALEAVPNVIVVTAQNRVQDQQDVPIKIDVVDAEALQDAGFSDANDLSKVVPVAMVQQDQGTVEITVRGVGNTAGGSQD